MERAATKRPRRGAPGPGAAGSGTPVVHRDPEIREGHRCSTVRASRFRRSSTTSKGARRSRSSSSSDGDDGAVDERAPGGRRLGLASAAPPAAFLDGEHQLARLVIGPGAPTAAPPGLVGMLAGEAAQRVRDERCLRRVRPAGRPRGRRRQSPPPRSGPWPASTAPRARRGRRRPPPQGRRGRRPFSPRTSALSGATARRRRGASPAPGRRPRAEATRARSSGSMRARSPAGAGAPARNKSPTYSIIASNSQGASRSSPPTRAVNSPPRCCMATAV